MALFATVYVDNSGHFVARQGMGHEDRARWNRRYHQAQSAGAPPSAFVTEVAAQLPTAGRALDVAGGLGRNALWLATRGLDVTLADTSDVALAIATSRAQENGVPLRTLRVDLEATFPEGPWDLILCLNYLQRSLFEVVPAHLTTGGLFVFAQPTRTNLTRHPQPSARFLLNDGELSGLVQGLEIVILSEGWTHDGRHEARLLARRT